MDAREARMDSEFDQYVIEMKPLVLRLPHKAEKQRSALWIKKLCDPPNSAEMRKNRNLHSRLLLHMLKRGSLDGPFAVRPEEGPLKSLPSYMSIFFDEPTPLSEHAHLAEEVQNESSRFTLAGTPDWVKSELENSSALISGSKENIDPQSYHPDNTYKTSSPRETKPKFLKTEDPSYMGRGEKVSPIRTPWDYYTRDSMKAPSTFRDEQSLIRMHEKELEMKSKVLQAQFHEDKLKLQHKHDIAVQKILDRKNSEIDEMKSHYRAKERDYEESADKMDRRVQSLMKEIQMLRDSKDKQIEELKVMIDEASEAAKTEYDAKVDEAIGAFERDKYELQKTHTKNIQQLLDDTNQRLAHMEEEYNAQTTATKIVISELEGRVSQLTQETEALSTVKQSLIQDKQQIGMKLERAEKQLKHTEKKYASLENDYRIEKEDHDLQIKSLLSKHDANSEFIRQENNLALNKAQEMAKELEGQIQNLKHALQDSEQFKVRELRERESLHQQDLMSVQHLHDKQLHQLRTEWDQDKAHHGRELRSMEDIIRDRDEQIARLTVQQKQSTHQAEQAIEDYKKQVNDAQQKVYSDMQRQLEKMEADLDNSKKQEQRVRDELHSHSDELKSNHQEEMMDLKLKYEREKAQLVQEAITERDKCSKTYENQLEDAERRLRSTLEEHERVAEERKMQNQEVSANQEAQIRELREELVSSNALRRQQLVELGLLREEERQKAAREHDATVNRLESEIDRQRLEMHRQHATELDRQAQKTKSRLENLEQDYKQRLERAFDRISDLQQKENSLRDEVSQAQIQSEKQLSEDFSKKEDDMKKSKMHLENSNYTLKAELEAEREKSHALQRQMQRTEFNLKDELTRVKMQNEERIKGMLPSSLRQDMEDTILCLRSQISSLQQRISILEGELDDRQDRSLQFSVKTPSTISPSRLF